jgi:CHAT domain-containing protein
MVRSGDDLETARAMGNVGQLYSETAEYELAESLLTRALALAEKALGPDALDTAATLNKLAFLYTTMGSYARAEPLFSRSLRIFEKVLGLEHPAVATNLENLAQLYAMTAVYQRPEPLFERALVIKEKTLGANHPDTARTRFDLALLDWREGRWVQANSRLTRAVLDRESSAVGIFALGDESRKRAYAQTLTSETYAVVTFALSARKRVSTAEPFAMEVVLQRKGRVLDVMADTLATIRKSLGTADEQLLERWRDTLTEYESLLLQGPKAMPAGQYRQLLAEVEAHASWLEGELSQRSAVLRRSIEPVTLARVKQALPKDAVLVEWFRYEPFNPKAMTDWPWYTPHYVAFILKPAGAPVAVDVGEVATIEKTIQDLLAALHDPRSTLVPELARELDTMLLQPLRPYLENTEHILLSPDGELNLLPFGVLMDERGRYLMDVAELTYLTSGRDLLRLNETLSRQAPVIFANPDFGTVDASPGFGQREAETDYRALLKKLLPFQALRGTATEAAAVQELLHLDARQVLTERNATVTALKALRGPRILHLASHGFFLPDVKVDRVSAPRRLLGDDRSSISAENPLLRSGLALANANRLGSGDDAGILTALEASGLDLAGTELAVLSACETGVGQVQIGEGVYGLRRALALAGVQTQVTSLWRVDDLATKDLMVDYYARLSQGAGRSAALRAAQTTIRKNPERRHPHYWAGFVVIGDPRPLTR